MDCYDERNSMDMFKRPTTYQNDYKPYCDHKKEVYKRAVERYEPKEEERPPYVMDDHETFSKWTEGVHIPFDLLHTQKPIVGTDPLKPFQLLAPIEDTHKQEAIKAKPRVYMTPAFCMDDVDDPETREILCNYMYTTEWRNAEKEGCMNFKKHKEEISLDTINTDKAHPVQLQVELYKPIEERFQRQGKDWDTPQMRSLTDPTKEFWIHNDSSPEFSAGIDPFKDIVSDETKQEISDLIAQDKIRFPHDYPPPTYTGYRVRFAKGIPLPKEQMPITHPYVTTYQAMTARYLEDMKK